MKLRCYCCGAAIGDSFVLAHAGGPADEVDRVFVMSLWCAPRTEGAKMLVEKTKTRKQGSKKK